MNWLERYFSLNGIYHFVLITVCYLVLLWLSRNILINDLVIYNSYSEQLTYERALRLFEEMERLSWINYVAIPFVFLIKFILISIVLYIGIFFCSLNTSISFGSVFRTVIACEIVFVLAGMLKFLWFYFFVSDYNLNDINFFYPLSLINLFRISEIDKVWIYPLQSVNLFQVIYILLLSSGLCFTTKLRKTDSDKVVLLSYVPALLFWIVLIMFFSIDSSI
jgi:hypothetical protein